VIVEDLQSPLLADGQFVWGPNVGDFDVHAFLSAHESPLVAYADSVVSWAGYASVNPQVVLTLLELRHGLVTAIPAGVDRGQIDGWVEEASMDLASAFYDYLYSWGSRLPQGQPMPADAPVVAFADGSMVEVSRQTNAGTYAIVSTLAMASDRATWSQLISPTSGGSFAAVFDSFFPDADRLDDTNQINPATLPPDDLFQFPFPLGATWSFNGPHNWNGGSNPPPFSSMDFSTTWPHDPPFPYHYTVAAAGGTGTILSPNPYYSDQPCWVRIDHGGGWTTSYYHLRNLGAPGSLGSLQPNAGLGTIAEEICNGGFASGAHVHFSLLYNGAYVDLEGIKLSGWTVHVGPTPYTSGFIERGGQTLLPYDHVLNDYQTYYGRGDHALRFYGNSGGLDRVRILIDNPTTDFAGPAADVGWQDFTIEWWMQAWPIENAAGPITCGANENWRLGNIILDASRSNQDRSYGVSLVDGKVAFGVSSAGVSLTLCSTTEVADDSWHHVAILRNRWDGAYPDGYMWLYVDGNLEAEGAGPVGDLSYPDDAIPLDENDPYLLIGGGKDPASLSFSGWVDEMRLSDSVRYAGASFSIPSSPFLQDSSTIVLYRFDEGIGDTINDVSGYTPANPSFPGGPSNGLRIYGGSPAGPEWLVSDLFLRYTLFFPVIAR
jgi:LasA protease